MPVKAYDGLLHPAIEVVRGKWSYYRLLQLGCVEKELNKKLARCLQGMVGMKGYSIKR